MRQRAFFLAGILVVLLSGCGSGSRAHRLGVTATAPRSAQRPGPTRGGLSLSVSDPVRCTGPVCTKDFLFTTGHLRLTKPQALKLADHLAHGSSLVVRDLTCHAARTQWRCTYVNQWG